MKLTEGKAGQSFVTLEKLMLVALALAVMGVIVTLGLSLQSRGQDGAAALDGAVTDMGAAGF
jgi:hypothetical protein